MANERLEIFYKEDIMEILGCSDYIALNFMKESGCAFTVGKKYAISVGDFFRIMNQKSNGRIEYRSKA